jgi:hypothetical protein
MGMGEISLLRSAYVNWIGDASGLFIAINFTAFTESIESYANTR